jgi:hypothetical protein
MIWKSTLQRHFRCELRSREVCKRELHPAAALSLIMIVRQLFELGLCSRCSAHAYADIAARFNTAERNVTTELV